MSTRLLPESCPKAFCGPALALKAPLGQAEALYKSYQNQPLRVLLSFVLRIDLQQGSAMNRQWVP